MKFRMIAAAMAVAMSTESCLAATTLTGGDVTGSQTWGTTGAPYLLEGDVTVTASGTLILQPGVVVQASASDALGGGLDPGRVELDVSGVLLTNAASGAPVTFEPAAGAAVSSWYGIDILSGGSWTALAGTVIQGNVTLSAGSTFSGRDVDIAGNLRLGGTFGGGLPAVQVPIGSTYTLFDLTGAGTVTGTFAGLAEGATFALSGNEFAISYHGGTGNDVVLTAVQQPVLTHVPEPGSSALMLAGWAGLLAMAWRGRGGPRTLRAHRGGR